MIKHFCDICGKEMAEDEMGRSAYKVKDEETGHEVSFSHDYGRDNPDIDVCRDCVIDAIIRGDRRPKETQDIDAMAEERARTQIAAKVSEMKRAAEFYQNILAKYVAHVFSIYANDCMPAEGDNSSTTGIHFDREEWIYLREWVKEGVRRAHELARP